MNGLVNCHAKLVTSFGTQWCPSYYSKHHNYFIVFLCALQQLIIKLPKSTWSTNNATPTKTESCKLPKMIINIFTHTHIYIYIKHKIFLSYKRLWYPREKAREKRDNMVGLSTVHRQLDDLYNAPTCSPLNGLHSDIIRDIRGGRKSLARSQKGLLPKRPNTPIFSPDSSNIQELYFLGIFRWVL